MATKKRTRTKVTKTADGGSHVTVKAKEKGRRERAKRVNGRRKAKKLTFSQSLAANANDKWHAFELGRAVGRIEGATGQSYEGVRAD